MKRITQYWNRAALIALMVVALSACGQSAPGSFVDTPSIIANTTGQNAPIVVILASDGSSNFSISGDTDSNQSTVSVQFRYGGLVSDAVDQDYSNSRLQIELSQDSNSQSYELQVSANGAGLLGVLPQNLIFQNVIVGTPISYLISYNGVPLLRGQFYSN